MMFISTFFFSAITIASVGLIWVVQEYDQFKKESGILKNEYIENQKYLIKTEVLRALDLADYSIKQTEILPKESIKKRVYESHEIATNLYNQFHNKRSESELKRMIIEALRNVRFNSGRGYYFITDFNGIEQLFADHPELEGKDLSDMRDLKGKYVIRDMINIAKNSKEGFYQYLWTKPKAKGNHHIKIAFVKHFEPFNWFIGTGEYLDDTKNETQTELLKRLIQIRFRTNGYLFGTTYKGEPLFTNGKITKGTNSVWDVTDPNGIKMIQEQRNAVRNVDGGFYRYSWKKLNSSDPSPKLSFSKGIPEWEWMIGAGVYMDDIDKTIALRRDTLLNEIRSQFIKISIVFLILVFIAYLAAKYISTRTNRAIEKFLTFFDKASTNYVQIDSSNMIFSEFIGLADLTNKVVHDREESKQALSQSEARWRSLTENSPDHILTLEANLNIQFANYATLGLTVEELIGTPLYQYIEGDEKQAEVKAILESVLRTGQQKTYETEYLVPDGDTIYYESSVVPRKLEGSEKIIGLTVSSRDISERKQAAKSLRKLSSAIEQSPSSVVISDLSGEIEYVNPKFVQLTGYSLDEVLGKNPRILQSGEHPEEFYRELWNTIIEGKEWQGIFHNKKKNGDLYWELATIVPIRDDSEKIINYLSVKKDITEQRQAEEQLKASLKEKNTLIDEIHHRVKNNMNVVSSLLKLQANNIDDEQTKEILKESQSRIFAMAAIHESIHGSENLSEINLKQYLSKIVDSIFQTYSINPAQVKLQTDIEEIPISINQASPLGLTVNELLSNSLKYAFPKGRTGEVNVSMKKLNQELHLTVMDDGVGILDGLDWKNSNTLGLKLVRTLVENQLDGSIKMESNNGTKFSIKFNIET